LVALLLPAWSIAREPFRFPEAQKGKAELSYHKGVPVVVVEGTPEEIGTAMGSLVLKNSPRALNYPRDILDAFGVERLYGLFESNGKRMFKNFPPEYRQELSAMARAAGADEDALIVGNTLFDLKKIFLCSAMMVEPARSATGGPLLGRNLDYPSLGYVHEYSLVAVYRPRGKHAFAAVTFPGLVGVLSGMNDAGLSLGVLEVLQAKEGKKRFNSNGLPYGVCFRKLLEECTTVDEAHKMLLGLPRTCLLNLVIADRDNVAVFEITPEHVIRRDDNGGTAVCTNHFCHDELKVDDVWDVAGTLERLETLAKVEKNGAKVAPENIREYLNKVHLGDQTLQTMVFEPRTLTLHLSIGVLPSSQGPLRKIELAPLLKPTSAESGQ
jgi:predicted choloylglycine hydrolase